METNPRKNGRPVPRRRKKAPVSRDRGELSLLIAELREKKIEHFKHGDLEIKGNVDDDLLFYSGAQPHVTTRNS